jgi:hypothetical protein
MNKGNQLAKDAIAEAKVIRATALEQAKLALEEAFTPHLQSILAAKLNELEEDDDVYESEEEKMDEMIDLDALLAEEELEDEKEESEDEESEDEKSEDEEEMDDEDMDISSMSPKEVEDYIRQIAAEEFEKLEAGEHEEGGEEDEEETEAPEEEDDDEEINLDELFNESEDDMDNIDESDDIDINELLAEFGLSEEEEVSEEDTTEMEEELYEARSTIKELRSTLHEVNLLNSKLLYMNKVFKANNLTESQKIQIVKTFDKTESVKEVKLVYESLTSTLTKKETNRSSIKESLGFASKPSGLITQTNNSKVIDSDIQIDRWAKLAGLK